MVFLSAPWLTSRNQRGQTALHSLIISWPRVLTSGGKFDDRRARADRQAGRCLRLLCQHGADVDAKVRRRLASVSTKPEYKSQQNLLTLWNNKSFLRFSPSAPDRGGRRDGSPPVRALHGAGCSAHPGQPRRQRQCRQQQRNDAAAHGRRDTLSGLDSQPAAGGGRRQHGRFVAHYSCRTIHTTCLLSKNLFNKWSTALSSSLLEWN